MAKQQFAHAFVVMYTSHRPVQVGLWEAGESNRKQSEGQGTAELCPRRFMSKVVLHRIMIYDNTNRNAYCSQTL